MRYLRRRHGLLQWVGVALLGAVALASSSPARAQTLAEVRAKLEQTMRAWEELRELRIEVKDIEGLSGSDGDKGQLEARLKTLLTKKRSNREWLDYWAEEQRLVGEIAALYEKLAPLDPADRSKGLIEQSAPTLLQTRKAAEAALQSQTKARRVLEADVAAAKAWFAKRAAAAAVKARKVADTLPDLEAAANKAQARYDKAKARLEAAEGNAKEKAAAEAKAAKTAWDKAVETLTAAQTAVAEDALLAQVVRRLADGTLTDVPTALTGEAKAKATTLAGAATRLETMDEGITAATQRLAEATAAVTAVKAEAARLRGRRPVLDAWMALAKAKQANQELYYQAINADIEAVQERLRGIADKSQLDMLGRSDKVCDERVKDHTALERYYDCQRAIKQEAEELSTVISDTQAAVALNKAQLEALDKLLQAQKADDALVRRELSVADTEWTRSQAAKKPPEVDRWRNIWSDYAARARVKAKALREAVRTSRDTQRALKVNEGFYTTELEGHETRLGKVEASLEARSTTWGFLGAALKTAWQFLSRAYMVPIYLLIAWLLLRLSTRVEEKVVTKARENQSDRDAVQRVETLSTVARGGFKLVVYVATVLMCLVAINVDIGPLLGGAAIFGLAISFGSQSLVKDVVTGFFILLEDQYAVGDYIKTSGVEGTVEKVTLRRTVLRDLRGVVHTVPNGSIDSVSNHSQGWARVVIDVGVAYGTDLDTVREVIDELGEAMFAEEAWQGKITEPPKYIGMTKFDASSIVVRCMFKTEQLENYAAEREFNRRIHDAFAERGIEIPYDKLDVTLLGDAGLSTTTAEAQAAPAS